MTLDIETLGARGEGIARSEAGDIFVPYTLPGERVAALVAEGRGRLQQVLSSSPHRAPPPCAHFGDCGGCALQHLETGYYLSWKRALVVDALRRAGFVDPPVAEVLPIEAATRRRATFAVERRKDEIALGFLARASHRIVPIGACHTLHPELFAALPALKKFAAALPADWRLFDLSATLCENGLDVGLLPPRGGAIDGRALAGLTEKMRLARIQRLSVEGEVLMKLAPPVVRFAGVPVALPPGGFLQASKEGEDALVRLVVEAAAGARRALDLFCGAGSFSLPLSQTATVHAADSDAAAIAALSGAARLSPHRPIATETRNLFERPLMADELEGYDVILFDPPRAGAPGQARQIAAASAPKVIAVSCNPSTFARDAALLAEGGYRLDRATPVDQFVYSSHIELVAVFSKERSWS